MYRDQCIEELVRIRDKWFGTGEGDYQLLTCCIQQMKDDDRDIEELKRWRLDVCNQIWHLKSFADNYED